MLIFHATRFLLEGKDDNFLSLFLHFINICCTCYLNSANDDMVWPSSLMADMIEQRIKESNFKYSFQNISYENAGHLISTHPAINSDIRTGKINIDGKDYEFEYGGTTEGDKKAKQDAAIRLMEFVEKI